ncbi:PAS domain S-box protein [Ancylomarina sp. YFZ004]
MKKIKTKEELQIEINQLESRISELERSKLQSSILLENSPLQKNQYCHKKTQEIGKIGIWELDLLKNELIWTDQNFRNFGIPMGTSLTYEIFLNYIHPEDREYVNTQWTEALTGKPYDIEHRIVIDGNVRWLMEKADVVFDANGKPISAIGFTQDITEHKQNEEKLKTSMEREKEFADIVRKAPIAMAFGYPDGRLENCNSAFSVLTGYSISELQQINWNEVLTPSQWKSFEEKQLSQLSPSQKSVKYKKEYIHKDGHFVPIELTVSAKFDSAGNLLHYIGFAVDITERKKTENELRLSEEKFRSYVEQASEGIYLLQFKEPISVDMPVEEQIKNLYEGYIIEANDSQAKMYGFDKANELNGMTLAELHGSTDNPENLEFLRSWIEANYRITDAESKEVDKDGNKLWFTNNVIGHVEDGYLIHIWGTQINTTEKKQAEETLKESEERFRRAITYAPYPIMIHADGEVLQLSEEWTKQAGYTIDDIPTIKKWSSKAYGKDAVPSQEFIDDLYKIDKTQYDGEWQVKIKNGSYRLWDFSSSPIGKLPNGKNMVISMVSDITDRKLAEQALGESEEKYRVQKEFLGMLINTIPSPIFYKDLQGRYIGVNAAFTNFMGISAENIIGKSVFDISPQNIAEDYFEKDNELFKNPGTQHYESKIHSKDGKIQNVIFDKASFTDTFGTVKGLIGIITDITERKQIEVKIKESESNLIALINNTTDSIWSLDRNYNYIIFNTAYADIFLDRYGIELKKGMNAKGFLRPEELDFWVQLFDAALNGENKIFEFSHDFNGVKHYFQTSLNPIFEDKKITGVSAMSIDITNTKNVEEKLKESEEHFRFIVEQSPLSTQMFTPDGMTAQVNSAYKNLWGITLEELKGYNILEDQQLVSLGIMPYIQRAFSGEATTIPVIEYDTVKSLGTGKKSWVQSRIYPVKDNAGNIDKIILIHEDITESKQAEEKIRIAEKNLQNTFDLSPSIIAKANLDTGYFIEANKAVTRILGYSIEEFTSRPFMEFLHPDNRQQSVDEISNQMDGKVMTSFENKFLCKDGSYTWMAWHGSKADENGIATAIGSNINVRKNTEIELKIALEKALESDRLKSAFLANMSHEIRTPMNGIMGFIDLLNQPNLSHSEINTYSDIINKSSDRLLNTINDIIDLSRVEAGEVLISNTAISIQSVMNEIYNFHSPEAELKGLSFSLEPSLSPKQINIITDSDKLHGILTNLVKNAIKYTEKGSITFGYSLKNNCIEFFVDDTGIGIQKDRTRAIFNRFEQADIGNRRAFEGSGLGLAISKAYAEMLGGEIWVKSELGKGSVFYFTLPYKSETTKENSAKNEILPPLELSPINSLKILIVEDDEVSRELISITVQKFGKEIIFARTGAEAVSSCLENPDIDLVLMDIQLPEMDGYEATRKIRKFNKDLTIVAQTAYAIEGDKQKAIEAGCNDYISKPINKTLLLEIISKHVGNI